MENKYAIVETENGVSRYFLFWDHDSYGDILQSQEDLDSSVKLFDEAEAKEALRDFRFRCRKIGFHLKSELVKIK